MSLELRVDARLYPEPVVLKTAYWFAGKFSVDIAHEGGDTTTFVLRLESTGAALTPDEARLLEAQVRRRLIDQRTRQLVLEETRSIRDILVAKAFADVE